MKSISAATTVHSLIVAAILLGVGAAESDAHAAGLNPKADPFDQDEAGVKETYRQAIKDGVAEYEARRFEEALSYFRRAHHLSPNARTFRGIGMASFELRDYVTAMRNLLAALPDQRKPLSDEQRKDTQDLLERCRLFVAVYTLTVSPSKAHVTIDAKVPDLQPDGSVLLGLGEHLIEARADGYLKRSLSVKVRGGERSDLLLTLDPMVSAPPVASAARAELSPSRSVTVRAGAVPDDNRVAKRWLWASGGAALLAAGAGVYWALQNPEIASCRAPQEGVHCKDESALVWQRNIGIATTVAAGVAALTMATVGILSWRSEPASSERNRAFACQIGPFGLVCGRTF
jgi:hypothetical protein